MPRSPETKKVARDYDNGWRAINRLIRRGGSWSGHERDVFYLNLGGGRFADISGLSGLDFPQDGRAFATIDLDDNGWLDLIVKHRNAPQVQILRNSVPLNHRALVLELVGRESNRQAVGAVVTVETPMGRQRKQVRLGSGYLSQDSRRLHFGLGDYEGGVRIRVEWPSGRVESFEGVPAHQRVRLEESTGRWTSQPLAERRLEEPSCQPAPEVQPAAQRPLAGWLMEKVPPPGFTLPDLRGRPVSLESFRGRRVLLNFWATWCAPCQVEMRHWRDSYARLRAANAEIVAVSVDEPAEQAKVEAFASELQLPFPVLLADERTVLAYSTLLAALFEADGELQIPTTFLLDTDGSAVKVYRGPVMPEAIAHDLANLSVASEPLFDRGLPFGGRYFARQPERDFFRFGYLYYENGLLADSSRYFGLGLKRAPRSPVAWMNLGVFEAQQGNLARGVEMFQRALALDPQLAEAYANLGILYFQLNRREEAEQAFRRAMTLDPQDSHKQFLLGMAYAENGNLAAAIPLVERYTALEPRDAEGYNLLGVLYARQGEWARSQVTLQRAAELRPDFAEGLRNLGVVLLRRGSVEQARHVLERAVALDGEDADAHFALADAYLRTHRTQQARDALRRGLELRPDHPTARALLERLERDPRNQ